jgi:hypothetical protein
LAEDITVVVDRSLLEYPTVLIGVGAIKLGLRRRVQAARGRTVNWFAPFSTFSN